MKQSSFPLFLIIIISLHSLFLIEINNWRLRSVVLLLRNRLTGNSHVFSINRRSCRNRATSIIDSGTRLINDRFAWLSSVEQLLVIDAAFLCKTFWFSREEKRSSEGRRKRLSSFSHKHLLAIQHLSFSLVFLLSSLFSLLSLSLSFSFAFFFFFLQQAPSLFMSIVSSSSSSLLSSSSSQSFWLVVGRCDSHHTFLDTKKKRHGSTPNHHCVLRLRDWPTLNTLLNQFGQTILMHRTDSSFRRHPTGGSLRRFSFRRKPTRESLTEPVSTWSFNNRSHEWQLLRGNALFDFLFLDFFSKS